MNERIPPRLQTGEERTAPRRMPGTVLDEQHAHSAQALYSIHGPVSQWF